MVRRREEPLKVEVVEFDRVHGIANYYRNMGYRVLASMPAATDILFADDEAGIYKEMKQYTDIVLDDDYSAQVILFDNGEKGEAKHGSGY